MSASPTPGTIGWVDLTVPDADTLRDFYRDVAGWEPAPVDMGGYSDWAMGPPGEGAVAGVCNARGANADMPPVWMIYIIVADLDASLAACAAGGGEVVRPPRDGTMRFAVIRDPAGAICGLFEAARE